MADLHTNGTANCAESGAQNDIVERLRSEAKSGNMPLGQAFDALAVADEIERLRAVLEVAANRMSMTGAPQTVIDAIRKAVRGG